MIIYGAGMAGLLAGQMLRRHQPRIREAQAKLPNNHAAVLRFRTRAVAEAAHIPFKKVLVHKGVWWMGSLRNDATLEMQNMYSLKVAHVVRNRSILSLDSVIRWVAPPNFIDQLSRGVTVEYNAPLTEIVKPSPDPAISTIPMPEMMKLTRYNPHPDIAGIAFTFQTIWTLNVKLDPDWVDVYQSIYYPEQDYPYYRASLVGNQLIIEFCREPNEAQAREYTTHVLKNFGITRIPTDHAPVETWWQTQKYGKLVPIPESTRQAFIVWLTDEFNIYSLGRFGTWRQILMDDIVQDIQVIDSLIGVRSRYARTLSNLKVIS